ncbi:MAG: ABC transporter substrate-binding protein [Bacillota bacterium]
MRNTRILLVVAVVAVLAVTFGQAVSAKTVIQYWTLFTGPDGKYMEQMGNRFNQENPDIEVRMQVYSGDQYLNKLTLGVRTGTAPDVAVLYDSIMPRFIENNSLEVLNDALRSVGIEPTDYHPLLWEKVVFDGKVYGIPLGSYSLGLYYNKDLFKAAGLDPNRPPTTLEEFIEYGKRLTVDKNGKHPGEEGFDYNSVEQWGIAVVGGWQPRQLWQWLTTLFQNGGTVMDPVMTKATFYTPEGIEALRVWVDFIYKYRIAPDKVADPELLFMTKKIGMHMNGPWMVNAFMEKGLNFGAAPVPLFGKQHATWAGTHILVLPRQRDRSRIQAALRFVDWLTEHSLDWAKAGQVPARLSVLESREFKALPVQSAFARQLDYVRFEQPNERNNEIANRLIAAIEDALLNRKTPEQALKEAAEAVNSILSR